MSIRSNWDYALRIGGVTFETLGMARLAEYMARFAELLGPEARPTFAGAIKGSVVLRAKDRGPAAALTRTRMRTAANDETAPARAPYEKLARLLRDDCARGSVVDKNEKNVIVFPLSPAKELRDEREFIISDKADLDGVVVGVEGIDDTAHLGLQDPSTLVVYRIQVRDMRLAREAAGFFRGEVIRVKVHGTWRRDGRGWHPHSLYADAIERLDQSTAAEVFGQLHSIQGTGWATMTSQDAERLVAEIRGDH